jgi:hypothetical protein
MSPLADRHPVATWPLSVYTVYEACCATDCAVWVPECVNGVWFDSTQGAPWHSVAPLSLGAGNVAVLLALMCLPVVSGNCAFNFITLLQFAMGYCAGFVTTT